MTPNPLWVPLTLLCALAWAAVDGLSKRALRDHTESVVLAARWFYALPLLLASLAFVPAPRVDGIFWGMLALSAPLEIWAMFLYLRAIAIAPLSLTAPLLAWTPVFSAGFSAVVLRELPSPAGFAGVLLVAGGSWLLYSHEGCEPLEPLRCIARERGARLMLAVALLFSVTTALGKVGLLHSSAGFFGPIFVAVLAVCLVLISLLRGQGRELAAQLRPNRWFVAVGTAMAAMTLLHFAAIGMTQVAYMLAVKRSSLLASVLIGRVFFGERGLRRRLPGAALMLAGVVLLGIYG